MKPTCCYRAPCYLFRPIMKRQGEGRQMSGRRRSVGAEREIAFLLPSISFTLQFDSDLIEKNISLIVFAIGHCCMKKDRVSRLEEEDVLSRRRRSTTTPVSPSSSLSSSSSSSSHCSTSHSSSRWRNVALLVVLFFAFSSLHLAGILIYFITLYMYIKPLRCFWLSTRINIASYTFTWLLHKRRPTSSCCFPQLGARAAAVAAA